MSTNTPKPPVNVTDGASVAPSASRRLFFLEREASPVPLDRKGRARPLVRLDLPDNGSRRNGPGRSESGNVVMVVHREGCNFPVTRCRGECLAPEVATP